MRQVTMQKRHIEFIADTLKTKHPGVNSPGYVVWRSVVLEFAKRLPITNDNFQTAKFLVACGLD